MYDLVDRPVADLPAWERGLLGATRRWTHAFSIAGAEAASGGDDPFDDVMGALDRGSSTDLVIQRPCFATVEETEAVILSLWRLVRDHRDAGARDLARLLVDPRHAGLLVDGMGRALGH